MIRVVKRLIRRCRLELAVGSKLLHNEAVAQKMLIQQYRSLAAKGRERLPGFDDVGFRKYSQFEEDGILLYLFALVPPVNRRCVEICAGNGRECMVANLIINRGWWGYLFDGNEHCVEAGRKFFSTCKDTFFNPPAFTRAWITAENVDDLIETSGVCGPVDLLSLDIDGMDYWVWKAITVIEPRVFVCETNNIIPADRALTVPYDAKFACGSEEYRGASLGAMRKLGREKGYRLIGTHRYGFNAFLTKNGIGEKFFPEVSLSTCLDDPVSTRLRDEKWPQVQKLNWIEV